MCSSCFDSTKYSCIKCKIPICNKCSVFEEDEDFPGWLAGKSVGYCEPCANENTAEKRFLRAKPKESGSEGGECSSNEDETVNFFCVPCTFYRNYNRREPSYSYMTASLCVVPVLLFENMFLALNIRTTSVSLPK